MRISNLHAGRNRWIAKRTGLSRNTVKKWLRVPSDLEPKYKREPEDTKLKPFELVLVAYQ